MALKNLGVGIRHLFACDINKHAKATIMANFPPEVFYEDLTTRDNAVAPKADLYIAGFPCQPFSMAGRRQGFDDMSGRGTIFFHVRDYIDHAQPRAFVLENVSGLVMIDGGCYFKDIMLSLEELGTYNVQAKILDTKDHGIPQNRRRIYFVGIRKDCDDGSFEFPEPVPRPSIEHFLEPKRGKVDARCLPPARQGTAHANIKRAIKELLAKGIDPFSVPYIVDCDSSSNRMKYIKEITPCLTCSRAGGHWITNRGRRMTKTEMMRLQGMTTPEQGFRVVVTEPQLGKQIGNAMSVNVLERLFVRLLTAAGLAPHGSLHDRWAAPSSALASAPVPAPQVVMLDAPRTPLKRPRGKSLLTPAAANCSSPATPPKRSRAGRLLKPQFQAAAVSQRMRTLVAFPGRSPSTGPSSSAAAGASSAVAALAPVPAVPASASGPAWSRVGVGAWSLVGIGAWPRVGVGGIGGAASSTSSAAASAPGLAWASAARLPAAPEAAVARALAQPASAAALPMPVAAALPLAPEFLAPAPAPMPVALALVAAMQAAAGAMEAPSPCTPPMRSRASLFFEDGVLTPPKKRPAMMSPEDRPSPSAWTRGVDGRLRRVE